MVTKFNSLLLLYGDVTQQKPKIQRDGLSTNPTKKGQPANPTPSVWFASKWPIPDDIYIEALVSVIANHEVSRCVLSTGR